MKKLFAVLVALALVLSMGTIVFAADAPTGTITIKNTVENVTYSVYQMFTFEPVGGEGSTNGIYRYASDDWKAFVETGDGKKYLALDTTTGSIKWNGTADADGTPDATEVAALAKAAVAYAIANGIDATKSVPSTGTTVTFDDLALGYYAIDTTLGALCGLTTTDSTFEMTEKNEKPDIEKNILEDDGSLVDANNVNIGDTVTYQATITIGTGAQNYVMHDKMSDTLKYKGVTSVTVNDVAVDEANYTITVDPADDDCTFEIAFDDAYTATLAKGTAIVVKYEAELLETAKVGAEGNPNEAWLSYGDKNETTHEFVITYTTSFTVEKVDGNNNPLAGAGFTLYKHNGTEWVAVGAEKVITTLASGEKAIYEWNGLEEGQYKLVETTVPAGYNKAADIEFTITCIEVDTIVSGTETADWAVTVNDNKVVEENDEFKATVVNRTGSLLPETGGIGTTIFYVVGGLLMVAAFIILVSKKRMASFA